MPSFFERKEIFDQALTDYDRVIALDPQYADAWAMRGLLKLRMGQESEAQEDLRQFLLLKPAAKVALSSLLQAGRLPLASRP